MGNCHLIIVNSSLNLRIVVCGRPCDYPQNFVNSSNGKIDKTHIHNYLIIMNNPLKLRIVDTP